MSTRLRIVERFGGFDLTRSEGGVEESTPPSSGDSRVFWVGWEYPVGTWLLVQGFDVYGGISFLCFLCRDDLVRGHHTEEACFATREEAETALARWLLRSGA